MKQETLRKQGVKERGREGQRILASLYEIPRLVQAALIPATLFRDRKPACLRYPHTKGYPLILLSRPPPPRIIRTTYNPPLFRPTVDSLYPALYIRRISSPAYWVGERKWILKRYSTLYPCLVPSTPRRDFLNNQVASSSPEVARGGRVLSRRAPARPPCHRLDVLWYSRESYRPMGSEKKCSAITYVVLSRVYASKRPVLHSIEIMSKGLPYLKNVPAKHWLFLYKSLRRIACIKVDILSCLLIV